MFALENQCIAFEAAGGRHEDLDLTPESPALGVQGAKKGGREKGTG